MYWICCDRSVASEQTMPAIVVDAAVITKVTGAMEAIVISGLVCGPTSTSSKPALCPLS